MKQLALSVTVLVAVLVGLPLAAGPAGAASTAVYAAPAGTGVSGESSMAFVPTAGATLLDQLDNQQGSDADSTIYSQAFQVATDSPVSDVTWWGTGGGQTGFMVSIMQGVWPAPGSTAILPNGPAVDGTSASLSVVPLSAVTRTPAPGGLTQYTLGIPTVQLLAADAYRVTVTAVGGSFEWASSSSPGCCTGTSAVDWVRGRLVAYLSTTNVAFQLDAATVGPGATCTKLSGTAAGTLRLRSCTPSSKVATSATAPGTLLSSGGTLTWASGGQTTAVVVAASSPGRGACRKGSVEHDVTGTVTGGTSAVTGAGDAVSIRYCQRTVDGALRLVTGTTAHL
jgi:hypothetical protein